MTELPVMVGEIVSPVQKSLSPVSVHVPCWVTVCVTVCPVPPAAASAGTAWTATADNPTAAPATTTRHIRRSTVSSSRLCGRHARRLPVRPSKEHPRRPPRYRHKEQGRNGHIAYAG